MNPHIRQRISAIILLILIICLMIVLGKNIRFDVDQTRAFLLQYPLWLNGIIYILLYVISTTILWIGPKDLVRLVGALLYGGMVSTVLVYIAELINAGILFHFSRKFGRDVVLKKWFHKVNVDKAADHTTLLGIMALRINVLFSFRLLDLAYGLTRVSFRKYLAAAIMASPLRLFVIQYTIVMFWDIFKTIKTWDQSTLMYVVLQVSNIMMKHPFLLKIFIVYFGIVALLSIAAIIEKVILRRRIRTSAVLDVKSQGEV